MPRPRALTTRLERAALAASLLAASACVGGAPTRRAHHSAFHEPPAHAPAGYAPRPPRATVAPPSRSAHATPPSREELGAALGAELSPEQFASRYGVRLADAVSYDASRAAGLPTIQHSDLALEGAELDRLRERGMVVSTRREFPNFASGLVQLYVQDLPLYVTADSVLYAMHRSYESLLTDLESRVLAPALDELLERMRAQLERGQPAGASSEQRADLDLYLSVALALLREAPVSPLAGASEATAQDLVARARQHEGTGAVVLFGASQTVDFSQFTPRSHYTETPQLQRYFQSMIWLGRSQLRLFDRDARGQLTFSRHATDGAVALRLLMDGEALAQWQRIDAAIRAFVGESDAMVPPQVDALLREVHASDFAAFARVPDDAVATALRQRGYGVHRIASQWIEGGLNETAPQPVTFGVLPQRYTVDSHVLSNVVYDRAGGGRIQRLMPSALDAAFGALGNDLAGDLLQPELSRWGYARDLHAMRVLVDAHEDAYWDSSLYTLWLAGLRALSPSNTLAEGQREGLPELAGTSGWNRRLLNTQLASWAELRHNTVLYAEQSYTGVLGCSYPDAYVEPYPAFWAAMERFAARGTEVLRAVDTPAGEPTVRAGLRWMGSFGRIAGLLRAMAEKERRGVPFGPDELRFINDAVTYQHNMCGGIEGVTGWYADLFYQRADALSVRPTITDVHTQPTDAAGNEVGRVLHVATGRPRMMVATVDSCDGPRAYAGVVSSYFEVTTEHYQRLTDGAWGRRFYGAERPSDVPWMAAVLAGGAPRGAGGE